MVQKPVDQSSSPASASTDTFGCPFNKLYKDQTLTGGHMSFFRKGSRDTQLAQVETPASDRGFLIGVSTQGGHSRRIFHENHSVIHEFEENSIYIRNHSEAYKADLSEPFDFVLLEISPSSLLKIADDGDFTGVTSLSTQTATKDVVLANLTRALIPAFERPDEASPLFLDQMATAIGTYVVQRYGNASTTTPLKPRALSRTHERLAKSILLENLHGDISISTVAEACNLSRGYFIRAFRETTGMTPYQWLLSERVGRARELLKTSDVSLAEVAIACGFADQSHFTRVFSSIVGATPGNWRRDF